MLKGFVQWERYWVPLGVPVSVEPAGFLIDPKGFGQLASGSLQTLSQLWDFPLVVLCGEPASGKSTLLELHCQLLQQDPEQARRLLLIDFRTVLDSAGFFEQLHQSDTWQQWRSADYPLHVVIDGVDEGIFKIGDFLPNLLRILTQLDIAIRRRLRLKLVCRTLEWTRYQDAERRLVLLLSGDVENTGQRGPGERPVYVLCPLTRDAISLAAQESGIDSERFFRAIFERGVTELAAYPFTLRMLLREFDSGEIESQTRRNLYHTYARVLCDEGRRHLRTALPALRSSAIPSSERLFFATEVLAAVMILTGRESVHLQPGEQITEKSLCLRDISKAIETIEIGAGSILTEFDIESALDTAVFTDRGADRFGFVNRTMAESLTAHVLAKRGLRQLRPLFFQGPPTDRHVIPQLAQAAAWLCEDHPDFFEAVLECDVEVLLRTEANRVSDYHRGRIVDLLLGRARTGKLGFDPPLHFGELKYPGLAERLWQVLHDRGSADAERALTLSIAQESQIEELSQGLFELIESPETQPWMLARIADALIAIHKRTPGILLGLLKAEILARDVDFRVRGKALDALVPNTLSVNEAFKYLEAPGESSVNAYTLFLASKLPSLVSSELIPAFLRFLGSKDSWTILDSPFRSLGERVFAMALSHLENPEIENLIGFEWIRVVENTYGWSLSSTREIFDILTRSPYIRENLTKCIIKAFSERGTWRPSSALFFWQGVFPILQEDDLRWLLDMAVNCSADHFAIVSSIFLAGFRWFGPEFFAKHSEAIIAASRDVPKIHELLAIHLDAWNLDEPWVRKVKADHLRSTRLQKKVESQEKKKVPWAVAVEGAVQRLATESLMWIPLSGWLAVDGDWKKSQSAKTDIPVGWAHLSADQQILTRAGARKFLIENESYLTKPSEGTNFSEAGYSAATLLAGAIESDPELASAFRNKWIRTVVQHWSSSASDSKRRLLAICRRLDPVQTLGLLRENIVYDATVGQGAMSSTLHGLEELTDQEVLEMLWDCIGLSNVKTEAIRQLVTFIVTYSWSWFISRLSDVINRNTAVGTEQHITILATVFRLRMNECWEMIWPILQNDNELARATLLEVALRYQYSAEVHLDQVPESRLVSIYRRLAELYPIHEDPPFKRGPQSSSTQSVVAEFRNEIPRILGTRDSEAARDALDLLASEFEQSRPQLQWHLRQITARLRLNAWNRPNVAAVTRLLLDPNARLVISSGDLLEVVIESLERLQRRISDTANPLLYDFWFIGRLGQNPDYNHGPHHEEHIARRIASWLQDDLQSWYPAVINREVVPRWQQRTDITVEAPLRSGSEIVLPKVIIEVKGNWNDEVRTACGTQLVGTYMRNQNGAAAIYLVAWFGGVRFPGEDNTRTNKLHSRDFQSAKEEIAELVDNQRAALAVQGFVLDCSLR